MAGLIAMVRDPAAINYLLLVLYAVNAARWGFEGSMRDVVYWVGVMIVTIPVTFWR